MPVSTVPGASDARGEHFVNVGTRGLSVTVPGAEASVLCGNVVVENWAKSAHFPQASHVGGTMRMLSPGESTQASWRTMPWSEIPFNAPDYATALFEDFKKRKEGVALHITRLPTDEE